MNSDMTMAAPEDWFPTLGDQWSEFALIPRFRAEASMGSGVECHAEDEIIGHLAFKNVWLQKRRLNPKFLTIVDAVGDSMYPTINDGDVLLVDLRQKEPIDNRIFVIRMNQQLYAKRLQCRPGSKLVVHSDNPHSPAFDVDSAENDGLDIIGRVVWAGKDL
ncbi:MAG: helix-turn-helix transcriptional regulator [Magnetococcales bacterium]|nr:helix-turn-helix transcriptional regulator [Magnetococcales bacterium]